MPAHLKSAPVCDIDFYHQDTITDPVSAYDKMLNLGPVVWLAKNNLHAICGHPELVSGLRNQQTFSSGKGVSINEDINKMLIGSTLNSDPPQHDATRKITFAPLSPKSIPQIRELIETEAKRIVQQVISATSFDAATQLAPHLPLTIVRDLVGLGDYGKDNMLDWGAATFELMGNPGERKNQAVSQLKNMRNFLEDPATLNSLSTDGWAKRATRIGIDNGMEPHRAAELMRDYIAPSLDTTISAISYAIMLFAKYPDQWTKLRINRKLMKNAIEEIVRLNTPIRAFSRYITTDVEVAGTLLKQDTRALMVFGAANRDPRRFPNPHEFDIERKTIGHVGFGQGVHACLGLNLARLEMTCLFSALAEQVKRFEFTGTPKPGINASIHSFASVPVKIVLGD